MVDGLISANATNAVYSASNEEAAGARSGVDVWTLFCCGDEGWHLRVQGSLQRPQVDKHRLTDQWRRSDCQRCSAAQSADSPVQTRRRQRSWSNTFVKRWDGWVYFRLDRLREGQKNETAKKR